jgi:2',3'-cyclic-nucleotide 2'-phosphodiesterase / 3'-nucleotidase
MTSTQCYQLAILETTDLHCNIVPYDYYNDKKSEFYGLAKTATLIKKFQKIYKNSILVDNGDLIQGNALSDYISRYQPLPEGKIHPIFKIMNYLKYDIATVGNHDFNYGLEFLLRVTNQAEFPYICSNIFLYDKNSPDKKGEKIFRESYILEKILDHNEMVKIGFIGVAPPQILIWDKHILENKIIAQDIVEATKKQAAELKKNGADIIIVLAHSGILPIKYTPGNENAVYELTKIKSIDAVLSGHAHNVFPGGKLFQNLKKYHIDNEVGKINEKPVVMPGALGSHLGIIRLVLEKKNKKWKVKQSFSELHSVKDVEADSKVLSMVDEENKKVLTYIRSHVGKSNVHFNSWFSTLQPSLSSQFIQKIGIEFAQKMLKGSKWEKTPLLSAFAPLNTGSHGSTFINIPKGPLAIKDISNLYPYDNEIKVILVNGKQLKEWLEFSAQSFQQIELNSKNETSILNPIFPSFNFDCIYGVTYEIDITQPVGNRIIHLNYNDTPVKPKKLFAVVTNNYRAAGGGNFPNLSNLKSIVESTQLYRDVVIEKVKNTKEINVTLEKNWNIHPILLPSKQKIFFESSIDSIPYQPPFLTLHSKDEIQKRAKYLVDLTKF